MGIGQEKRDLLSAKLALTMAERRGQKLKILSCGCIYQKRHTTLSIEVEDKLVNDSTNIKKEVVVLFKKLFKEEFNNRPTLEGLDFKKISSSQAAFLTEPFSNEEIDAAVSSCNPDKSSGPDGFNFKFIKSAWDVIEGDVYNIIREFWYSSRLPQGSNSAFIALIPKVDNPSDFKDFRPISMVGCLYKIVAKLLSKRLQVVMNSTVGPHQSAFISER